MLLLSSHDLYGSNIDRIFCRGKLLIVDIFCREYLLVRWRLWCSMAYHWDHLDLSSFEYERGDTLGARGSVE